MTISSFTVSSRGGAFGFATYPPTSFFCPLISLLYYLDYMLWGMSPLASHAVNLLWHIVCGLLVWLLAQRMLRVGAGTLRLHGGRRWWLPYFS